MISSFHVVGGSKMVGDVVRRACFARNKNLFFRFRIVYFQTVQGDFLAKASQEFEKIIVGIR